MTRAVARLERAEARARGVTVERLRAMGREALAQIVADCHAESRDVTTETR